MIDGMCEPVPFTPFVCKTAHNRAEQSKIVQNQVLHFSRFWAYLSLRFGNTRLASTRRMIHSDHVKCNSNNKLAVQVPGGMAEHGQYHDETDEQRDGAEH